MIELESWLKAYADRMEAAFGERLVLLGTLLILLAVSLMQEKGVSVLEAVKRQQLWFRWLIYLAAIFVVLLTGIYGPGFAASSFIYFQF